MDVTTAEHSNYFSIKDDTTGKILSYYSGYLLRDFILVPYFVKQQQLYEKKKFICVNGDSEYKKKDVKTGKEVSVETLSKWLCEEVTLLMVKQAETRYGSSGSEYRIYYVLANDKGETIAFDNMEKDYGITFSEEQAYFKGEREKQLKQDELIAEQKLEEKTMVEKEKKEKEKFKNECINKYGSYNGELIAQGKVKLGMTLEMCKVAWGVPFTTSKTTTVYGVDEDWYYGFLYSLHFVNGVLRRIQE